jgi:NADH:ubiquinone oxidoreductase subunit 6 (subunit J)
MDSLHAIGFYVSAAISVGGGLAVAFLPGRGSRGAALAAAGAGIAGLYLSLYAGFTGLVALICYVGCALLVAAPQYRVMESVVAGEPGARRAHYLLRQVGAVAAGGLFLVLAYAAWRGRFAHPTLFYLGAVNSASVGRLLFAHDPLATEAVGALILVALVGAAAVWRVRERGR